MRNIFHSTALLAILLLTGACAQEEELALPDGTVSFVIGQAAETSDRFATRATPAELGTPLADRFTLTLQRQGNSRPVYDGKFVESLTVPTGEYTITAQCGEDVKIGRDAPYYIGTAQTTIETDKTASVVIPCRVANALVSVRFGVDAAEKARFNRHYTEYGLKVQLGSYSMTIASHQEATSIYFPAGSSPEFSFYGTLAADPTRQVSMPLQSDVLPTVFQAADHGILTLTLPDPESAIVVEIGKAEMETVTMEESIPLSWLPEPRVQVNHVYDGQGLLVGTDVTCFHPYPSTASKTVIAKADGTVVRTLQGSGSQSSPYGASSEWPYLSAGEYTVTYYILKGGEENAMTTLNLTVPQPNLQLTIGGYTSYTKYKEGNVSAANGCDAYTIYSPSASFNVSPSLLAMDKYAPKFTCSYAGTAVTLAANANSYAPGNQTGQTPSFTPYTLSATAAFDGRTFNGSRDFYITGLPVGFAPPKSDEGWVTDGAVTFESNRVQVGSWRYNSYILLEKFAVPQTTGIKFTYNLLLRSRAADSSVTITLGSDQLFYASKYAFWGSNYTYNDAMTCALTADATQFKCATKASIGGDNYVYLYTLMLNYN